MATNNTPMGAHDLIAGEPRPLTGKGIVSHNPASPGEIVWAGSPVLAHVGDAASAAAAVQSEWARWPREKRAAVLRTYAEVAAKNAEKMGELIRLETGKAAWESNGEAAALAGKVDITLDESDIGGLRRVTPFNFEMSETKQASCWFRPHGVMAVVGPFNFPAHLANGHIVPALLMGNTIVFKPSDKTPAVGQLLIEMFQEALDAHDAPKGVVNLVHGGAEIASSLVTHDGVDGVLFTGSWPVGRKILEANLDRPGRIVALEMGGNNPAVVMPDADLKQAAIEIARCAFNTTGQRCTCTRRAIIHKDVADKVIPAIAKAASMMIVGDPEDANTFMGPIVTKEARDAVFAFQDRLAKTGGEVLVESTTLPNHDGWYVTPGLVRVERFDIDTDDAGCDEEVFGPLLRVSVVDSLDEAIKQANATKYGLAASIFSKDAETTARFQAESRAGCVNVNCGTAGASSKLPFGGLGWSGNHRPAGSFAMDYCAIPIAGMSECGEAATMAPGMTFEDSWLG